MDLYPWNCCRTCLSTQTLCPIFPVAENVEKYSDVFFTITGLKVEPTDNLPQVMCSECVTFINESTKFRRKCEESYNILINGRPISDVKIEHPQLFKAEFQRSTEIDISTNSDLDDTQNFTDYIDKDDSPQIKDQIDIIEHTEKDIKPRKKRIAKSDLSKRKKNDKKEGVNKIERVKEEIECEYCHKILTSRLSLRNHYKIHTGFDVVCEHCGKKFITRRLLLMHCRAKHGYEKVDKCSFCDYRASNAEQVKIHERLHTGEKPYSCAHCAASFHRKSSYLQHTATHLPENTVQCDQCPARFKSVTLMHIHKNRHRAPQYTFRCKVCDNSFARRRNVVRHLQRIHGLPPDLQHIDRHKIT